MDDKVHIFSVALSLKKNYKINIQPFLIKSLAVCPICKVFSVKLLHFPSEFLKQNSRSKEKVGCIFNSDISLQANEILKENKSFFYYFLFFFFCIFILWASIASKDIHLLFRRNFCLKQFMKLIHFMSFYSFLLLYLFCEFIPLSSIKP